MVSKLKGSKTGERAGQEGEAAAKARPGSLVTQLWEALDNLAIVWNPGECEDWPDQNVSETEYLNDGVEKFAQGAHNIFRFSLLVVLVLVTTILVSLLAMPVAMNWSSGGSSICPNVALIDCAKEFASAMVPLAPLPGQQAAHDVPRGQT
ncbi:hypothetical protein H2203_006524 [Taxawa tesnikishii (nom. ined.)]|nr:hypothetical protein H2203_006524 [Dothideales sp. JES 119]